MGTVIEEGVRCGKPNCRCARGHLHGTYAYLYYRKFENGAWKLKKQYIPRSKVKTVKREISEAKKREKRLIKGSWTNLSLLMATDGFTNGRISGEQYLERLNEIA